MMTRRIVLLFALLSSACGGTAGTRATTAPTPIETLRARAEAAPEDAALQAELAEAEAFWVGGETARVLPAIERALALRPDSARLHLLRAWILDGHGEHSEALDDLLRVIAVGPQSDDPAAPFMAELALDLAGGMRGHTPRYDERMVPALDRLLETPGRVGLPALRTAATARIVLALQQGDDAIADAVAAKLGCATEWRAAGPFGPYALTTFDRTLPAEGAGPLEDRYDLGPGSGPDDTFDAEVTRCWVSLSGGEVRGGGGTVAEAFVEIPAEAAGPQVIAVRTHASFVLSVDGQEVQRVDRREALLPPRVYVPLALAAGRHEVELKFSTRSPTGFELVIDRLGTRPAGWDPTVGLDVPEPGGPFERALYSLVHLVRDDALSARETFAPMADRALPALGLDMWDRVAGAAPFTSGTKTDTLRRRLVRRRLELDPDAVYAAMRVALFEQGAAERAAALQRVAERWPDVPAVQLAWASELQGREQLTEAESVLDRMRAGLPESCLPVARLSALYRAQGRVAEANALVEAEMECSATSRARFDLAFRQHRWDDARAELERLRPLLEDDAPLQIELALALATGDEAEEMRVRTALDADEPPSSERALREIDALLAAGNERRALSTLDEAMASDPSITSDLRSLRRDLTGRDDLEPYRQDGAEIIARYEASDARHEDAGQVLVFDYMVTRVYEDGSSRHLVHQILKVQSEESVERLGQLSLGGDLLTLRSIKPDGRHLEPEAIAGLDSIPMTDLEIGDYVEYEYIGYTPPRLNGGFRSAGWSFDSPEQPFAFSQMVALVPADMELDTEELGGTPAATETRDGDLRVLRWTMEHVPSRPAEPSAVPLPPFQPTLRFAVHAGWEAQFETLHEGLLGTDLFDPAAQRLVRGIVGETRGTEAIRRVADWVSKNIDPGGRFVDPPPSMIANEQGNGVRVLRYLLSLAGFDARLVLAQQFGEPEPTAISTDGFFDMPLVLVRSEGAPDMFLWNGSRHAPWDFLPPGVRGAAAVVVAGGPIESVRISDPGEQADRHVASVDVQLADGGARLEVTEEFHGAGAVAWRSQLEQVPEAELPRMFREAYVPRVFAGAEVESFALEGVQDPNGPVVLRYVASVPGFGRRAGDSVLLPPIFPTAPAGLVSLPSRSTSMGVMGMRSEVSVRVHDVEGAGPPAAQFEDARANYQRVSRRDGDDLVIERVASYPRQIVPAAAYPDFARTIRRMSEAELTEVRVTP